MPVPEDPTEFYTHPVFITALIICVIMLLFALLIIINPKIRNTFKFLFKIYYVIALVPLYIIVGFLFLITLKRVNLFKKLREIEFYSKFQRLYLDPTETLNEMRENPENYHLWTAILISLVFAFFDTMLIILVADKFYHGQDSIITGFLNPDPPTIANSLLRGILKGLFGLITFVPSYFTIHFLGKQMSKNPQIAVQANRSRFYQVKLIYIAWAYYLFPDALWCIGFLLSLLFTSWEALIFTWVFGALCGILELIYQIYSINGIYDLQNKPKALFIWLISMIPAFVFGGLILDGMLAPFINSFI